MDDVKQFLASLQVHPKCADSILKVLQDLGVKTVQDLQFVEEEDLLEIGMVSRLLLYESELLLCQTQACLRKNKLG